MEVCVFVCSKVHGIQLRLDFVLLLDLGGEGFELGLGAGDEEDVEAFGCQLEGIFLADAIRCACDDRPGAFIAKLGELKTVSMRNYT